MEITGPSLPTCFCVLQTLDVDSIHLHYILCVLQCWIRRNCSLKPFWLAQNGAPAPDFFHHLAGVFLEMAPVAIGELARFQIEETERTDRLAGRRMQRRAGIESD